MKRTIRLLALILTLTLALSAAAMATEIDYEKGETNATKSVSAVSLVDGCELKFEGEKLKVTYTNSALKEGDMVIVFLLETADKKEITDDKVELSITPTSSNIKYIDQGTAAATATAGNGSVRFSVYPQNYTNAVVRIISANKDGTLTDVNVAAVRLNYTLGDVNGDGTINALDSLAILKYLLDKGSFPMEVPAAANTNGDGTINALDSLAILKYLVDKNSFPLGK